MSKDRRIGKELLTDELRLEIEDKLSSDTVIEWEQITNKPQLADDSWKPPVSTPADLPLTGNIHGDIRLTFDTEKYVFTWDAPLQQWFVIGANDTSVDWGQLQNKPLTFAPSAHNHVESDITDLDKYTKAEVDTRVAGRALSNHTHTEAQITNLDKYTKAEVDTRIAGRALTSHSHTWAQVTNKPTTFTPTSHTHSESDIVGLDKYTKAEVDTRVAGRALSTHTHTTSQVTDLQTKLDAKVDSVAGKVLSANDFTDADKDKLSSLSDNASTDYSTMLTAHNEHVSDSVIHVTSADKLLINSIPLKADKTYVDTALSNKANSSALSGHVDNATIHVNKSQTDKWDSAEINAKNYADEISITIDTVQPASGMWYKVVT